MDGSMLPRERLQDFTRNGPRARPTFSPAEMERRLGAIRAVMAEANVDAALFTSFHNINYYSDFLYCSFGRRYGLVVTPEAATSISAGNDGGQPARRSFGGNVTYTDWRKDNWFHAVRHHGADRAEPTLHLGGRKGWPSLGAVAGEVLKALAGKHAAVHRRNLLPGDRAIVRRARPLVKGRFLGPA